jgi:hypothetical protein
MYDYERRIIELRAVLKECPDKPVKWNEILDLIESIVRRLAIHTENGDIHKTGRTWLP